MADEYLSSKLTTSIDQLSLSGRTSDILKQNGVQTITDLLSLQREDLLRITGFTHDAMAEVRALVQTYLLPLAQQYTMVEVGKAIREIKQTKSSQTNVISTPGISQSKVSLNTSLEALSLSTRARHALMRAGIETVADLLKTSEFEIQRIWNVGTQTLEEIKNLREQFQLSLENFTQAEKSETPPSSSNVISKTNHLLTNQIDKERCEFPNIVEHYPLLRELNDINTIDDLLESNFYESVIVERISVATWEEIFKELKKIYAGRIRSIQPLSTQKSFSYEIEQLDLSKRTFNCLLRAGIKDFQYLTQLAFEDILCIKNFGPLALSELITNLRKKSGVINTVCSQAPLIESDQVVTLPYASIEILPLTARARNMLMRAGVKTVSDLLKVSEIEIEGIRNIGIGTFTEIRNIRNELQSSFKNFIAVEGSLTSSVNLNKNLLSELTCSIDVLHFSSRTDNLLKQNGIWRVTALLSLQERDYLDMRGVGPNTITEVETVKQEFLATISQKYSMAEIQEAIYAIEAELKTALDNRTEHLLVTEILPAKNDFTIIGFYPEIVSKLNDFGIYTDNDLLRTRLYRLAMMAEIEFRILKEMYGRLKLLYYRRITQRIPKLSAQGLPPYEVERFGLSKQTLNCLLCEGITTFQQLTQLTLADSLCIENLGALGLYELFDILRKKIDKVLATWDKSFSEILPEDALVNLSDYQFLKSMGVPLDNISVSRLALPAFLEKILKSFDIETVDTLASLSKTTLREVIGLESSKTVQILTKSLKDYFVWLATQSNWDNEMGEQGLSPLFFIWLKETTLERIVDDLLGCISHEKYRKVIRLRFGLDGGGQRTLEQVGEEFDVTRERIRQMEKRAIEKLKKGTTEGLICALYALIKDKMEVRGGFMSTTQIREPIISVTDVGEVDLDNAILLLLSLKPDQFVQMSKKCWGLKGAPLNLVEPVTKRLIKILQAASAPLAQTDLITHLVGLQSPIEEEIQDLAPTGFFEACLSIDDRFEKTSDDEWGLTKWHKRRTDEIIKALRKLGKPSHFTEIAAVANEMLPPSQHASARVYHAQISNKPHLFVWVGSGTFGLAEWGLKQVRFYVDIAEELLQKRGEPLSFEEIFPVINAEREASLESIKLMLGMNSRFRQYPDNKYGLASWAEEPEDNDDTDDEFFDDLKQKLFDDLFD